MSKSQIQFTGLGQSYPNYFGGALLINKRKSKRPLSTQNAIHMVLRSDFMKTKNSSFLKYKKMIEYYIAKFSEQFGVKVYKYTIQSNHIHFILRIHDRGNYKRFINSLTGTIAWKVLAGLGQLKEGRGVRGQGQQKCALIKEKTNRFFNFRPFTRILKWGRDFIQTKMYLHRNVMEGLGLWEYKKRKHNYKVKLE